jgi:transposase InsO family protein
MSWKECDVLNLRREFVNLAISKTANMSELCSRFGISRKTGYKWLGRFRAAGEAELVDRSRRPHRFRCPTAASMEAAVLKVRDAHPAWGGRKIRARLLALGKEHVPAASTITSILHRHGRITPEASSSNKPWQRFERATANELWQMDFKGEFRMTDGGWCYPLTLLDDHSRFSLGLRACKNQRGTTVRGHLEEIFGRYGLPEAMLMDNGTPWAAPNSPLGHTKLSLWLMRLDIRVIRGRPYHPQTQGKEERFHRTLKTELLQDRHFDDLPHTQDRFDPWREMYNFERPHEALGLEVPASRYEASRRSFPKVLRPVQYDRGAELRKVNRVGLFSFRGRQYKISEAFSGERIRLKQVSTSLWRIEYGRIPVGELDLSEASDGKVRARNLQTAQSEQYDT